MKRFKLRNYELAIVQKNDPARLRSRTVDPESRKLLLKRSRRKEAWRRQSEGCHAEE